jgi:vacuolar-type H+-ATPase subunit I/STV1
MTAVVAVVIALVGGFVQSRRHKDRLAVDVHLVWWMVWVVGIASVAGAAFHIFDGPQVAEMIGYTRGDGGFQWENAMGDLAIGVVGIMAYWFRGHFWLATIVVLTIQYLGDAAGHLYFWIVENNTKPYNIGIPLWTDILLPIVMWVLYVVSRRANGDALPKAAVPEGIGPDVRA